MPAIALALAISWTVASPQAPPPALDLDAWRDHLAPAADELRWREIPWQSTLTDGLELAVRSDRPLLLWLMNGHPLGCT